MIYIILGYLLSVFIVIELYLRSNKGKIDLSESLKCKNILFALSGPVAIFIILYSIVEVYSLHINKFIQNILNYDVNNFLKGISISILIIIAIGSFSGFIYKLYKFGELHGKSRLNKDNDFGRSYIIINTNGKKRLIIKK